MALRRRTYLIIIGSGLILLLSGIGSSYYWLTRIYLPEQIDANLNAKKMKLWQQTDDFTPPADGKISRRQLHLFIQINESLSFILHRMHDQFEHHKFRFAYNMIRIQPQWLASKYLALKRFGVSPREYDWIFDQVLDYMVERWKNDSISKLGTFGLDFRPEQQDSLNQPVNYELFAAHERELDRFFSIFGLAEMTVQADSK